jgi:hypothetical protein
VRSGHDVRAALAEVVDHGRAEGAALCRVRARADFVQQDQCRQLQVPVHRHQVGDVSRERGQAGGDRLFVADVGEDGSEHRQPRALVRGHMQPRLRHGGKETGGLERHGLAARVGSGHDQHARGRQQAHVHRYDDFRPVAVLRESGLTPQQEQWMARPDEFEGAVGAEAWFHAARAPREPRLGLHDVEGRRHADRAFQVVRSRAKRVGQREQDAPDSPRPPVPRARRSRC